MEKGIEGVEARRGCRQAANRRDHPQLTIYEDPRLRNSPRNLASPPGRLPEQITNGCGGPPTTPPAGEVCRKGWCASALCQTTYDARGLGCNGPSTWRRWILCDHSRITPLFLWTLHFCPKRHVECSRDRFISRWIDAGPNRQIWLPESWEIL